MKKTSRLAVFWSLQGLLGATALGLVTTVSTQALAADPSRCGVIAEAQAIAGASIRRPRRWPPTKSTQGRRRWTPVEIVTYDNHSSSADSVRASSAPSMKTRSTSSSQAISAKSCWRWNRGPRA